MVGRLKSWMMKVMGLPTCEGIEQFAYDYLSGELDPETTRKFDRHLMGCGNCWRFVQSYRRVAEAGKLLPPVDLDAEFELRVAEFLRENS